MAHFWTFYLRYWKLNYWLICPDLFTHAFSPSVNWISTRSELALSVWKFGQDGSRINHWGIFVPSIVYHWYFENESRIIPETLQHVHVRKTKASFMRWFMSVQNSGAFSGEWLLKNCNVSDWPLRWRNQNMSLIGYIAQCCKSAFAFLWGYS